MKIPYYPNEYIILALILLLSGFGIVMMYSASSIYAMNKFNNYMFFFVQQVKWLTLGIILMFIISRINYQILNRSGFFVLTLRNDKFRSLLLTIWKIIGPLTSPFVPSGSEESKKRSSKR